MADRHGPCTNNRLAELEQQVVQLTRERDEWAAKWQRMNRKYAELRWPGLTRIITGKDAGGVRDTSTIGCEHGTIGGNCPFCRDVPVVCECGSVPAYGEAHHHACTSPTQQEGGA